MRSSRYRLIGCGLSLALFALAGQAHALGVSDLVKINEVRIDATETVPGESAGEYVELYNAGLTTVYLDGAILSEEAGLVHTEGVYKFPGTVGGTTIPLASHAFMLIVPIATGHTYNGLANFECRRAADADDPAVPDMVNMNNVAMALANAGDDIHLYTGATADTFNIPCGTCVDGVNWGTGGDAGPISSAVCSEVTPNFAPVGASNDGKTIGRCLDGVDGNVSSAANFYLMNPTPRAANETVCVNPLPVVSAESRTPCAPLVGQSALVSCTIINNTSAQIIYTVNGGGPNTVNMTHPMGNIWEGTIPGQGVNGTLVEYIVRAINATPDTATGFDQGYFVGTKTIQSLRVNDVNGLNIYRFYGVNVSGNVTAPYGTFSTTNTDYYIQDATSGVNIFKFGTHSVQPVLGDLVNVSGTIAQFNGKLEISTGGGCDTVLVEIDSPGSPPAPQMVNSCADFEALEGKLIRMQYPELPVGAAGTMFAANTNYKITNCYPDTIDLFCDIDTNIDGTTIVSQQVDVTGIAGQFDTSSPLLQAYQIQPRGLSDLTWVGTAGTGDVFGLRPRLFQNAPNPFSTKTTITYEIAGASKSGGLVPVQLNIYDVAGRKVATIVNESKPDGNYGVSVSADQLGSSTGIYFYELRVDGKIAGRQKLVVAR